jgi:hypothetical protein
MVKKLTLNSFGKMKGWIGYASRGSPLTNSSPCVCKTATAYGEWQKPLEWPCRQAADLVISRLAATAARPAAAATTWSMVSRAIISPRGGSNITLNEVAPGQPTATTDRASQ